MPLTIKQMIREIQDVIGRTDRSIPEEEVLEALLTEADLWQMRLDELRDNDD